MKLLELFKVCSKTDLILLRKGTRSYFPIIDEDFRWSIFPSRGDGPHSVSGTQKNKTQIFVNLSHMKKKNHPANFSRSQLHHSISSTNIFTLLSLLWSWNGEEKKRKRFEILGQMYKCSIREFTYNDLICFSPTANIYLNCGNSDDPPHPSPPLTDVPPTPLGPPTWDVCPTCDLLRPPHPPVRSEENQREGMGQLEYLTSAFLAWCGSWRCFVYI